MRRMTADSAAANASSRVARNQPFDDDA